MSKKRILTIGFQLASSDTEVASFRSKTSLIDWDIVLFLPRIRGYFTATKSYQGRAEFNDASSFQLKDCCEHWRREIKQAVEAGKTVIVFLPELDEVYIDTGDRQFSGTGKNQKTTIIVAPYSNYEAIPATLSPIAATGIIMKLSARNAEILSSYWSEFEAISQYKVQLTNPDVPHCIVTGTGSIPVGAIYRVRSSAGTLLLLPFIEFSPNNFIEDHEEGKRFTTAAKQFAARMVTAVVALDKALRSAREITPEPLWASEPKFALAPERALRVQLLETEREVVKAQKHKEDLEDQLRTAGAYRALLYEKGKPLENILIDTLRLFGFSAERFVDSDSEFDVVFESEEGRLIGEVEGKDNKAINIDKFRQLSTNIQEDFQRKEVETPAKAVLFGNGYRLKTLDERGNPFTEKCIKAAAISSTALVFTPDLFPPVQYLFANFDSEYARLCRQAILSTTGLVSFPPTPKLEEALDQLQTVHAE